MTLRSRSSMAVRIRTQPYLNKLTNKRTHKEYARTKCRTWGTTFVNKNSLKVTLQAQKQNKHLKKLFVDNSKPNSVWKVE